MVNTVTGAIAPTALGLTLMHEHIIFGYPGYQGDLSLGGWDAERARTEVKAQVALAQSFGVKTLVDATPNECGRDPEFLKAISEETGLQIVCATGYYYEGEGGTTYFKFRSALSDIAKEIYDMMMTEVTVGIGKTGIKAGVIKLASSKDVITDYEKVFFLAGARVAQETGVPIITHTQEGTMGPAQARLLTEAGVQPNKIMIGHMDGNMNLAYHEETLSYGVRVAFDRCGIQMMVGMPFDNQRIDLFTQLVQKGYVERLHLSHDVICSWLGRPLEMPAPVAELMKNWHLGNVFQNILPGLQAQGLTDAQIQQIMVENPQALFS
ncbi:MAG: phosphotriesterase [Microscillaceae bacterium]